jgi:hypothetical protein
MLDIRVDREKNKGLYTISAAYTFEKHQASADKLLALHGSKDGARYFRDIQKYTAYKQVQNNPLTKTKVVRVEYLLKSPFKFLPFFADTITTTKTICPPQKTVAFTFCSNTLNGEGVWKHQDLTDYKNGATLVRLHQKMSLSLPAYVPPFFIKKILVSKITDIFEDIERYLCES